MPARQLSDITPSPVLFLHCKNTVAEAAELMAKARTDAGLVESVDGRLVGILTDSDVSIKVAASGRSLRKTLVEDVMTPSPLCVRESERADKALALMAEKRARHLPLLDADGSLSGMLDIAKVLYDAITRLEKSRGGDSSSFEFFPAMNRFVGLTTGLPLESSAAGEEVPTLAEALAGRPPPAMARPRDPIAVALNGLRSTRRSVLVLDEHGKLVGILSKSDVAKRALRTALSVDAALGEDAELKALQRLAVRDCMTPRPDVIRGTKTVLDALHKMHDGKYSNLPVVDDHDVPVAVVDVLDLLSASSTTPDSTRDDRASSFSEAGGILENFFSVPEPTPPPDGKKKDSHLLLDGVGTTTTTKVNDGHFAEETTAGGHHRPGVLDDDDDDDDRALVVGRRLSEQHSEEDDAYLRGHVDDAVVVENPKAAFEEGDVVQIAKPAQDQLPTTTTRASAVACAISPSTLKHSKPALYDVVGSASIDILDAKTNALLVTVPGDSSYADLKKAVLETKETNKGTAKGGKKKNWERTDLVLEYTDDYCSKLKVLDDASLRAAAALGQARLLHAAGKHVTLRVVHLKERETKKKKKHILFTTLAVAAVAILAVAVSKPKRIL